VQDAQSGAEEARRVGLCATCRNARRIRSDRGSLFFLCRLSAQDKNFPKYPALPVRLCSGFAPGAEILKEADPAANED